MTEATERDFSGKRVLVTGGTGFLGGRLVERLSLLGKAKLRVLVDDLSRAVRIARFPVEIAVGDVTRLDDVARAMKGCEVIFHCAYGNKGSPELRRRVNVEGTRNVMAAASEEDVVRVVHTSTVAVYRHSREGELDESAPKRYSGDSYADSKLDAEKIVHRFVRRQGLPATIIQPTVVFGPFAPTWTSSVLDMMKTGRVILVNGGEGVCNAVYVDDVVSAMMLAAARPEAVGENFLISGERPITWRHFFSSFGQMLGGSRTVSMSLEEAKVYCDLRRKADGILFQFWSVLRKNFELSQGVFGSLRTNIPVVTARPVIASTVRSMLRNIAMSSAATRENGDPPLDEFPIHVWNKWSLRNFESRTRVRIDKAKRFLGYQPRFDFHSGMKLVEDWARWANLIGPRESIRR